MKHSHHSWTHTTPAPDVRLLRQRVSRFIRSRARGRRSLARFLTQLSEPKWNALLFGGLPRDLMLKGGSARPRDIDVVVQNVEPAVIEEAFGTNVRRKTRFGGYVLGINGWRVDIWPLHRTWALREGRIAPVDPIGLTRSTFLNVEAVAVALRPSGSRGRQVYETGFFNAMRQRMLDINFEPNPFPPLCVVRSLIMAANLELALSPRLVRYIHEHTNTHGVMDLIDAQVQHYGFMRHRAGVFGHWLDLVREHIRTDSSIPLNIAREPSVQLELGSINTELTAEASSMSRT